MHAAESLVVAPLSQGPKTVNKLQQLGCIFLPALKRGRYNALHYQGENLVIRKKSCRKCCREGITRHTDFIEHRITQAVARDRFTCDSAVWLSRLRINRPPLGHFASVGIIPRPFHKSCHPEKPKPPNRIR